MTSSSLGVLKTIIQNAGPLAVVVDKMHNDVNLYHGDTVKGKENAGTPAVVVDKMHENAGPPAGVVDKMHNDVNLHHGDTVKGKEDKLEDVVASLNIFFGSDSKKGLVLDNEELQPPYNDIVAFLANVIEVQERGKEVDVEHIFLLEEKHKIISRNVKKLERSLGTRQQMEAVSTRISVCLRSCLPCHSSIAESMELTLSFRACHSTE
jgi:hypothetical protein